MVDVTVVVAVVTTLTSIIMASLLFCCWRRKDSGEINKDKAQQEKVKQKSESPSPEKETVPVPQQENGEVTMRSSPHTVDANDDLGDFSAVQRETEILRSYRKPPPPKNRARQSRAPRAFKSSTEQLDIFTELNEDENKENIEKTSENNEKREEDEIDSSLLRARSEDKQKSSNQRDARSSMMEDIEQTLAALHMNELSTVLSDTKGQEGISDAAQNEEGKEVKGFDKKQGDDQPAVDIDTPVTVKAVSPDIRTPDDNRSSSPRASPIAKPKRAPKVSPKPTHKLIPKLNTSKPEKGEVNLTVKMDDQLHAEVSGTPLVAGDSEAKKSDSPPPVLKVESPKEVTEPSAETPSKRTDSGHLVDNGKSLNSKDKTPPVTDINESGKKSDDSDSQKGNTTSPTNGNTSHITDKKKHSPVGGTNQALQTVNDASSSDSNIPAADGKDSEATSNVAEEETKPEDKSSQSAVQSQAMPSIETTVSENYSSATSNGDDSKSDEALTPNENITSDNTQVSKTETETSIEETGTHTCDTTEMVESTLNEGSTLDQITPNASENKGRKGENGEESKKEVEDLEAEHGKPRRQSSEEHHGKQRRESAEDQSGKGKNISKIPVRAGSKPRSSPPWTGGQEKPGSPH